MRFSCTFAESTPSCSWTATDCSSTAWLNRLVASTSSGDGDRAQSVSQGSMLHMAARVPAKASVVATSMVPPKPASARTLLTSLVERDMRSPVRCVW